jgi:ATP-dependent helicase Lhr and Lhr-like helicase
MYECLDLFSSPTKTWFRHAFSAPTNAQRQAWPLIKAAQNVLVVAPTGSGKTLAAFLAAIDGLMVNDSARHDVDEDEAAVSKRGVSVLYVSPLKALGVDVERNLRVPLEGIAAECDAMGVARPDIDVAIRSGDTTPKERRRIAAHPPDILITTPESLYLLLTSQARHILKTVQTVILDEVHALAATKRGAHLALSLERLDELTERKVQRIGLSATVNPAKEVAFFLGGDQQVSIVDATDPVHMDLKIVEPVADMTGLANSMDNEGGFHTGSSFGVSAGVFGTNRAAGGRAFQRGDASSSAPSASPSIWPAVERSILDEILSHHSTLVFVNSRGLAERLTARLNDLYAQTECGAPVGNRSYGEGKHYDSVIGSSSSLVGSHPRSETIAMAHHGSVSKERRKVIENDLKHGRLRCVVATSSLELGIDMGAVDMVIQIAPPLSVSSGLQRVGRADHRVGGTSHALFYPLTRQELLTSAATVECMRDGRIEPLSIRHNPLDILAQQTVAAVAMDDWHVDDWYASVCRTAPFADLSRSMFDNVIGMLTGAYDSEEFSAFRPPLQLNDDQGLLSARPGAQRLAVTSGGTIPDRGTYSVVLPEADAGSGRKKVGELDEEMVYESRVGDVITLGTSTWQIDEITNDRVVVTPAPGRTARLPFWHGEGPGRYAGFGALLGAFTRDMGNGLVSASSQVSKQCTSGVIDTSAADEAFTGSGIDKTADSFEPIDSHKTTGLRIVDGEDRGKGGTPGFHTAVERRLRSDGLDDNGLSNLAGLLAEQMGVTGVLPTDKTIVIERCRDEEGDWRIILHSPYGRRVHEPWALAVTNRLKRRFGFDGQTYAADDGIVVRLPEQDSQLSAADLFLFDAEELLRDVEEEIGDSVLFATRFRECAARSLYMPRMNPGKRVPLWQQRLRASELLAAAKTQHNFPLVLETARECLQDVYDLPALKRLMTDIDEQKIEVHDVTTQSPSPFAQNLLFGFVGSVMYEYDAPQAERRASLLSMDPEVLEELLGSAHVADVLDPEAVAQVEEELRQRQFWNELDPDDVSGRIMRFCKTHGPFNADEVVKELRLDSATVVHELDDLTARGLLMTGSFVKGLGEPQYLHREVFRRMRSRSRTLTSKSLKPVSAQTYQSWLFVRQGIGLTANEEEFGQVHLNGGQSTGTVDSMQDQTTGMVSSSPWVQGPRFGVNGLLRVIGQLEGMPLPAAMWESAVFPARVPDFTPSMLDELLSAGEVIWVGSKDEDATTGTGAAMKPGKIAFYCSDSPLLGDAEKNDNHSDNGIMATLYSGGSYRADQLEHQWRLASGRQPQEVVNPLTGEVKVSSADDEAFERDVWSSVWQGSLTNSSFAPVRALIQGGNQSQGVGRAQGRSMTLRRHFYARSRVERRPQLPRTLAGLWSAVVPRDTVSVEQRAISQVETLIERYGIIAPPLIDMDSTPLSFSDIYPVLKQMEASGVLVRGMFVRGLSAAQFAERGTVDQIRQWRTQDAPLAVTLDAVDPASLAGAAVAWPEVRIEPNKVKASENVADSNHVRTHGKSPRPMRKVGSVAVFVEGKPCVYAAVSGHHLICFDATDFELQRAFTHLADTLGAQYESLWCNENRRGNVTFRDVNGETLSPSNHYAQLLRSAGFAPSPQSMRLYR